MIMVRMGELTLKGRNRKRFERAITDHLYARLEHFPQVKIQSNFGRMYIHLNGERFMDIAEQLSKTFGIASFSPVERCEPDLGMIRETALRMMNNLQQKPNTFKVSVRRVNKQFLYNSQDMNKLVGEYIFHAISGLKVELYNPDVELRVEIREKYAYIFCEVMPGLGGYPAGSNGKAIVLLSGGIDSPVAGWLAMRRGLEVEAVHFHSFPYTSERAQQKVIQLAERLAQYCCKIVLHMVPFAELQLGLKELGNENVLITLMRRSMMRIATELAYQRQAKAIVTGESLGQVASQTLPSMTVIEQAAGLPVLRPLIMMDKQEIVNKAIDIGTYPTSILPYEDCCTLFVPKSPSTNPNRRVIDKLERRAEWLEQSIRDALERVQTIEITDRKQRERDDLFRNPSMV